MAVTARELITRAYYLSGIVARAGQEVSGQQIHDGLQQLNDILDIKSVEIDLIPYWTYDESLVCTPGVGEYFIENCVAVESVTFNIDPVRYSMTPLTRKNFFASPRVDNIETLPFSYNFNREKGGGTLRLYFIPDSNYPLKIMAKFALTNVTLDQDMELVYDSSYIAYLRFVLCDYLCMYNSIEVPPGVAAKLLSLERTFMDISPPDLSRMKTSILQGSTGLNWGDVNLGKGYRP